MEISRVCKECFRCTARKFHIFLWLYNGCSVFDRVSQEIFKGVSLRSQVCFHNDSEVFLGSFKKMFKVFQRSFMLNVTHCSYLSRRRACFPFDGCFIFRIFLYSSATECKDLKQQVRYALSLQ